MWCPKTDSVQVASSAQMAAASVWWSAKGTYRFRFDEQFGYDGVDVLSEFVVQLVRRALHRLRVGWRLFVRLPAVQIGVYQYGGHGGLRVYFV